MVFFTDVDNCRQYFDGGRLKGIVEEIESVPFHNRLGKILTNFLELKKTACVLFTVQTSMKMIEICHACIR